MAVAFDAATIGGTFDTTSPFSFDHTPTGTPRGATVEVVQTGTADDLITAVTYGGVALERVARSIDTNAELGASYIYHLGESVPTGTQSVEITHTGTADVKWAGVATVTASADTEVGAGGGWAENAANPTTVLASGPNTQLVLSALFSGGDNILTVPTGFTSLGNIDFGNSTGYFYAQTTPATGQIQLQQAAGSDDVALTAVGVQEKGTGVRMVGANCVQVANWTTSYVMGINGPVGRDWYVAAVSRDHTSGDAAATCTDSSGNAWTLIGNTTDRKAYLWWKKSQASDMGAQLTIGGTIGSVAATLFQVADGDTGDPTNNATFEDNASGDESHAAITPDDADSLVFFGVYDVANDTNAATNIAGATLGSIPIFIEVLSTGGSDCRLTIAGVTASGGPTTTGTVTWDQTNSTTKSLLGAAAPFVSGQNVAVGQAIETESANPVTPLISREVPVGQAIESELGQSIDPQIARLVDVGQAVEVEVGQSVTPLISRLVDVGQAVEVELGQAITPVLDRAVSVGQASEVEFGHAVTPYKPIFVDVLQAIEAELGLTITPVKTSDVDLGTIVCEVLSPSCVGTYLAPTCEGEVLRPTCEGRVLV